MKIALVKQDVYQDLYVNARGSTAADLLFSSIMRVGPIGLFTRCQSDFLIVREENSPECRAWEKVISQYPPEWFRELKEKPFAESSFPEARFFQPGTNRSHAEFAVSSGSVDWEIYDIVISLNFAIPTEIVKRHRNTLWCYMIGEANLWCDRVHHGYDVCLNQETRGIVASSLGVVDFPYTFAGSTCLESIMRRTLGRDSEKRGIFAEVNSLQERPVKNIAHLKLLESTGHPIRLHQQSIKDNLTQLFDSKYFVKVGGRKIRGNSVIEAISAGAVVLMNPAELHHSQILPKESWIYSLEDACARIAELEKDPLAFAAIQETQRKMLDAFVVDMPLESLRNCLHTKRTNGPAVTPPAPSKRSLARRVAGKLKRHFF